MNRDQIDRRLSQLRAAAEWNVCRLIRLRKVSAPVHSEVENLIDGGKLLTLGRENHVQLVRLHRPADALLLRERQIVGGEREIPKGLRNGRNCEWKIDARLLAPTGLQSRIPLQMHIEPRHVDVHA